jgi:hypothetical protein
MKTSIIVLFILICPLYNHAQTINIGVAAGGNMNLTHFYNVDFDQSLLLSSFSPTYGGSFSYSNKNLRSLQASIYYNKSFNSVKVPEAGFIPFDISFKMNIKYSYMQYMLSYQIPLYASRNKKTNLCIHSDIGINTLMWDSFGNGVFDTLVHKASNIEEVWLNYSYYTRHKSNFNIFLGTGLNLNQKLSNNFSLQIDFAYKFGFKPLTTMRIEYIIHQTSPQDSGIYSSGVGLSASNSLTSRLSLIYHLHTHKKVKK